MHITILALGSHGDIQPYAVLGAGLVAAGHQVRFITFEAYASLVASNGPDFHSIQGDPQALVAGAGADTLRLVRSFASLAQGYARDLSHPELRKTDLILNQLPAGLYGFSLAEAYQVPMALVSVIPLARTRAFPMMGFPRLPLPGYNRATYRLAEHLAWQPFRVVINRWRQETLSLPPLPMKGYLDQLGTVRVPILNGFSVLVVPRPADWGSDIYQTGYWMPDDQDWEPSRDLEDFIESGPLPVFIGFGSMPVKDPLAVTSTILAALRDTGQRAVLHMGWGGIGDQDLPDSVYRIDYAPYRWLFPRMGMVVHHGGSGTTGFALRSGVPSCAVSFVFDQHYWGQRIAALGAGPSPIRFSRLTAPRLADAIQQGLTNPQIRSAASQLGRKLQAEDGIGEAIQVIERIGTSRPKEKHGLRFP